MTSRERYRERSERDPARRHIGDEQERRGGGDRPPARRLPWSRELGPYSEPGGGPDMPRQPGRLADWWDSRPLVGREAPGRREAPRAAQPIRRGPYAGLGPKDYRRSDERLAEELCDRLTHHPDIDPREVNVEVVDRVVTLSGAVPDRWTKHEIEDLVEIVLGVEEVRNHLRVGRGRHEESRRSPASSARGDEDN